MSTSVLVQAGPSQAAVELCLVFPLSFGLRKLVWIPQMCSVLEGEKRLLAQSPPFLNRVTQIFLMLAYTQVVGQIFQIGRVEEKNIQ